MKKLAFLILLGCIGIIRPVYADDTDISTMENVIYVSSFSAGVNSQVTMSIKMKNTAPIRGFQFNLYLPEGVTAKKSDLGRIQARLSKGRLPDGDEHSLTLSEKEDGSILFLCGSQYDETFTGTDGEIATIDLIISGDIQPNDYPIILRDIQLTETNINNYYITNEVRSTLTIMVDARTLLDEASTTAPTASAGAVDVLVKRTIKAGEWSTICLPFAMTAAQVTTAFGDDVQLADFVSYDTVEDADENVVGLTVNFTPVTAIEANHPYVIKVSDAITQFTVDNVTIDPEEEPCVEYDNGLTGKKRVVWGSFIGTYVADFEIPYSGDDASLFLSGNKMYYASAQTQHMKAYRAYFWFWDILTPAGAEARISLSFDDESEATSTLSPSLSQGGDAWFDLSGRKLGGEPTAKGVYIHDGNKVLK